MSQVTNTKCTELFKNVVDNSNLNSLPLDPYLWKLNDRLIDIILSQNISTNINDIDFSKTARLCGQVMRRLTPDIFERKLLNNEVKFRDWLLYSKSTCVYFVARVEFFLKYVRNLVKQDLTIGKKFIQKYPNTKRVIPI